MEKKLTNRQRQAIETRNRILTVAMKLFDEKKFENVSMEEIAEQAQVSIGAIYYYFQSKEEIAAKSVQPLDDTYHDFFIRLMESEEYRGLSPLEKFREYYVFIHRTLSSQFNLRDIYVYCIKNSESSILKIDQSRILYQDYQSFLRQCREQGLLVTSRTDSELVLLLTQASRGMLVDHLMFSTTQEEMVRQAERWFSLIMQSGEEEQNPAAAKQE